MSPDRLIIVLAALAVVLRNNQVLLVRRRNPPDAGLWGYPGGKVELGETVAKAAMRELQEETGVIAAAGQVLDNLDVIGLDGERQLEHHFHLVAVHCRYHSGEPVAADDAAEAEWHAIDQVLSGNLQMSRDVDRVLRRAMAIASTE